MSTDTNRLAVCAGLRALADAIERGDREIVSALITNEALRVPGDESMIEIPSTVETVTIRTKAREVAPSAPPFLGHCLQPGGECNRRPPCFRRCEWKHWASP